MTPLLERAEEQVRQLLQTRLSPELRYHNLQHTTSVVAAARHLGMAAGLSPAELEALLLAAWFHDTGFVQCYTGHEAVGQAFLEAFLRSERLSIDYVDPQLIAVTRKGVVPDTKLQRLLKDADLNNLGTSDYPRATRNLRHELRVFLQQVYTDAEWYRHSVAFMRAHRFYSIAGKARFATGKAANLKRLLAK